MKTYNRVIETSSNTPSGGSPQSISLSATSPTLTFVGAGTSAGRKFVDKHSNGDVVPVHVYQTNSPNLFVKAKATFATGSPNTLSIASADITDGSSGAGAFPTWSSTVTCAEEMSAEDLADLFTLEESQVPGGRLTLTSGVPDDQVDQSSKTTVYYTPFVNDVICLWDGNRWAPVKFSEVSLALGTVTAFVPYDIFGFLSSGALALEKQAWLNAAVTITIASPGVVTWTAHGMSNDSPVVFTTTGALPTGISANTVYYVVNAATNTFQIAATTNGAAINTSGSQSGTHTGWQNWARGTNVTLQDGRYCKSGDKTRLYLGTIATDSTTTTSDSSATRLLWNMYNRVRKQLFTGLGTSHTYGSATLRLWNNDPNAIVRYVVGFPWALQYIIHADYTPVPGGFPIVAHGPDITYTYATSAAYFNNTTAASIRVANASGQVWAITKPGRHFSAALEGDLTSSVTDTFDICVLTIHNWEG
jgi:hypothetical protein